MGVLFLACARSIAIPSQARKAMQEQLDKNKELMQKVRVELPEEEPADVPEEDLTPVTVPTIPMGASGANPWMLGKPSSPAKEPEVQEGLGDVAVPAAVESKEEMEEEEEEMSEEEALLQDFAQKRHARQQRAGSAEGQGEELAAPGSTGLVCRRAGQTKGGRGGWFVPQLTLLSCSPPCSWVTVSHLLPLCVGADEAETVSEPPGDSPIQPICAEEPASPGIEQPPQAQEEILLSEQLRRVQTMEDVEALASEERAEEQEKPPAARAEKQVQQQEQGKAGDRHAKNAPAKKKKKKIISLQAMLAGKSQEVQCPSLPVVVEEEVSGTGLPRGPRAGLTAGG